MNEITAAIMIKALDGLSARATVTAQNIANANTPGYRPLRVSFEDALAAAAPKGLDAIAAVSPQIGQTPDRGFGTDLRLDLELATAGGTAARYAALIEILGRQLQIQSLAAAGAS